jgi:hypothetical protein
MDNFPIFGETPFDGCSGCVLNCGDHTCVRKQDGICKSEKEALAMKESVLKQLNGKGEEA